MAAVAWPAQSHDDDDVVRFRSTYVCTRMGKVSVLYLYGCGLAANCVRATVVLDGVALCIMRHVLQNRLVPLQIIIVLQSPPDETPKPHDVTSGHFELVVRRWPA